jgi:hypothetical protein
VHRILDHPITSTVYVLATDNDHLTFVTTPP